MVHRGQEQRLEERRTRGGGDSGENAFNKKIEERSKFSMQERQAGHGFVVNAIYRLTSADIAPIHSNSPQFLYDGVPQPLTLIAIDGSAIPSSHAGAAMPEQTSILLPSSRRAEFIVLGPAASVADARLVTAAFDTGPIGDNDPARPLIRILPLANATAPAWRLPLLPAPIAAVGGLSSKQEAAAAATAALYSATPAITRRLYFSQDEVISLVRSVPFVLGIPPVHWAGVFSHTSFEVHRNVQC